MNKPPKYCMVLTTCKDRKEAETLAESLVDKGIAACVQLSEITSFYKWDNKFNRTNEQRLIIKARASMYPEIQAHILTHHSYEVPQIVKVPITDGTQAYLGWIDSACLKKQP